MPMPRFMVLSAGALAVAPISAGHRVFWTSGNTVGKGDRQHICMQAEALQDTKWEVLEMREGMANVPTWKDRNSIRKRLQCEDTSKSQYSRLRHTWVSRMCMGRGCHGL